MARGQRQACEKGEFTCLDYEEMAHAIGEGFDNWLRAIPEGDMGNWSPFEVAMRWQMPRVLPLIQKLINKVTADG